MKRVVAALLMFAMVLTGFLCFLPEASESKAASSKIAIEGEYTSVEKAEWNEDEDGVPQLEGYLFAGYYSSATCTASTKATKENATHAKFVRDDMLDVKVQVTNGVVQNSYVTDKNGNKPYVGKYIIRFISSVESLNYSSIGFVVEYKDAQGNVRKLTNTASKVFETIDSTVGTVGGKADTYNFSPKIVGQDSEYFITAKLPVADADKATVYTVRAFYVTPDGTKVFGNERAVSVNDGQMTDAVNMQVKTDVALTDGAVVTFADSQQGTVQVLSYNEKTGIANVRVTFADSSVKGSLQSATKFVFATEDGNTVDAVYRNYYTTHEGAEGAIIADTSWYDVNPDANTFQIATAADLYGLAKLVNEGGITFAGKEIHLTKSIAINTGDASTWSSKAPTYAWTSIGNSTTKFQGIFDGDGNEISGIYMKGTVAGVGFIGYAGEGCELREFKFVNSFMLASRYESDGKTTASKGNVGLVGIADSVKISSVYSDAIVHYWGGSSAAFVGQANGDVEIDNCWFDGHLYHYTGGYNAVFVGHVTAAAQIKVSNCLFTGMYANYNGGTMSGNHSSSIIGGVADDIAADVVIENCLVLGKLNIANDGSAGRAAVAGTLKSCNSVVISNVYVAKDQTPTSLYCTYPGEGKSDFTNVKIQEFSTLKNAESADMKTFLASKAWVMDSVVNDTDRGMPILRTFAEWWKERYEVTSDTDWYIDGTTTEHTITTAEELYGLAELSKTYTFAGVQIKLGSNIVLNEVNKAILSKWQYGTGTPTNAWTPIGTTSTPFTGTFDGQGYTISGLYFNVSSSDHVGLFGTTAGTAAIQNFKLVDSYMKSTAGRVGIVGRGTLASMENIYTNAIMETGTGHAIGGMIGELVPASESTLVTFNNCWFDGTIVGGGEIAGGIVGNITARATLEFNNCLNTGSISCNKRAGGFVGYINNGWYTTAWQTDKWVFNNCLSVGTVKTTGSDATWSVAGTIVGAINTNAVSLTLNNTYGVGSAAVGYYGSSTSANTKTAIEAALKTRENLIHTDVATLFDSDAWVNDNENGWNNTDRGTPVLAQFADWWKGNVDHNEITVDISWYNDNDTEFTLNDLADFYGFAYVANNIDNFAGKTVKLGNNIKINPANADILVNWKNGTVVPGNTWTPIGTTSQAFAGIFDGQGYTISGLYLNVSSSDHVGLFGNTAGTAVIQNFKLVDSYMKSTAGRVGIVGRGTLASMENIYTNAIMETGTGHAIGGMIGELVPASESTLASFNNCWFDGTLTGGGEIAGGIIGNITARATLEFNNCLNTGSISCNKRAGGFIGYINSGWYVSPAWQTDKWVFNNCLSVGTAQSTGSDATWSVAGTIVGAINTNAVSLTLNNTYGVGSAAVGYYGSSTSADTKTAIEAALKTRENLIHTDVATLFNSDAWVNDNENGWNNTDRGTPVLAQFADWWIARGGHDEITADISWYNDNDTEFTLNDLADFYGFAYLANNVENFAGKTVKLGADMNLNKVNDSILAAWKEGTATAENVWTPIGNSAQPFAGIFDGQGYVISGLYLDTAVEGAGLFGYTSNPCEIRNFKLVDSFMKSSNQNLGIVGRGSLVCMENIYTNAIVISTFDASGTTPSNVGGFVGVLYRYNMEDYTAIYTSFRNCWFDGYVENNVSRPKAGGILGGLADAASVGFYNCLSTGTVTGGYGLGGFFGVKDIYAGCEFRNCLSLATVSANPTDTTKANYYGSFFGDHAASAWNSKIYNSYGLIKIVGNGNNPATGTVTTRTELINTDEATLFPVLSGETVNGWVNDIGYNLTDRGTPILAAFSEWWLARQPETELMKRADTSWYNDTDTEFVIDTAEEFYGFAILGQTNTFEGKTIKLGANIVLNKVDASILAAWKSGTVAMGQWTPLVGFAGIFDGQGYTISGLYLSATTVNAGIFGTTTATAVIKNFKLVDSYMKSTAKGLGIVGGGTFASMEGIYTNAIMVSTNMNVAGFAGSVATNGGTVLFENCWFDGEIIQTGSYLAGGFVGEDAGATSITFRNCLSTGTITAPSKVGGFMGWINNYAVKVFENCLSVAKVTATDAGGTWGGLLGELRTSPYNFTVTNLYVINTQFAGDYGGNGEGADATYETTTYLKNRDEICGADITTLFAGSSAWVVDNENGWNDTDRGTPILATFADFWRERQPEFESVVDMSWYNEDDTEFTLYDLADLRGFVAIANNRDNFAGKTVKLGADIVVNTPNVAAWKSGTKAALNWTPIGTTARQFAGTFDGQGYAISGLYLNRVTSEHSGMFGNTTGSAVIKNFKLVDSYMKATAGRIGIVGRGTLASMENIYTNAVIITNSGFAAGGMIGELVPAGESVVATFSNCWFDGTLTGGGDVAGGIVGNITARATLELNNCLFTGSVSCNKRAGGFVGYINNGWYVSPTWQTDKWVFNNCLSVGTVQTTGSDATWSVAGKLVAAINTNAVSMTLNNTYVTGSGAAVGYYGSSTSAATKAIYESATVLKNRQEVVDAGILLFPTSNAWSNDIGYNDTNRGTPILASFAEWWLERNPADGLKDRPDITWYDENETEFVLTTPSQMYGFAQLAKVHTFEGKTVKLGGNIVLNDVDATILADWQTGSAIGRQWTPIGTASSKFAGIFDGQGYTISGLYHKSTMTTGAGLFGNVAYDAQIKDFKLVDAYISASGYVGMIGEGLISSVEKVYSNAIIESDAHYAGGMLGYYTGYYVDKVDVYSEGIMTFEKCWFDGVINMKGDAQRAGGIVGGQAQRSRVDILNCLYTGHMTAEVDGAARLGGLFGWVNSTAQYNFTNCLSAGTFAGTNMEYVGGFVGNLGNNTLTLTNCYTLYAGGESVGIGVDGSYAATYVNSSVMNREDLYLADLGTLFEGSDAWVQDIGYNDTDRGTPILAYFATWWTARQDEGDLEVAPSTTWYTNPATAGEYVIQNKGDLLGFLTLSKNGETFAGKTIKLGANITLNTPNVQNWKAGTAPTYEWTPVGTASQPFAGQFDGQGHSISGIYVKSSDTVVGFFGKTAAGSTIKNFRLLDSYIEQTFTSHKWSHFTGSVVADASGDISGVYSNAIIVSPCHYVGGIVGRVNAADNTDSKITISNSWFAGSIELADEVGYSGGIAAIQQNGKLYFENVLSTGHIKANFPSGASMFIGGILGKNTLAAGLETHFESVVSAGTYNIPNGKKQIASIVGYLDNGFINDKTENVAAVNPQYSFDNVFANREWNSTYTRADVENTSGTTDANGTSAGLTSTMEFTGQVIHTSSGDRLIGYVPQSIRDIANDTVITDQKLDFTADWTIRTNGVPIPTVLKDVVDARTIVTDTTAATLNTELGLGTISGSISNAVAESGGDYVVTVEGTQSTFETYVAKLVELGFLFQANNYGSAIDPDNNPDTPMEADGIFTATYYKNADYNVSEWVVNVTFVTNDGKLYVSINSDVDSMPETLLNDDTKNPLGKEEGDLDVSLSMIEDKDGLTMTGNCFVIQLPNGHFIINDGNTDGGAGAILKDYLVSIVGEGNPIYIDAWFISHFHNDHAGALIDFASDASLRENVYLNALYANMPSAYGATLYENRTVGDIANAIQGAKLLTKEDGSVPDFYEVHMGQRYYFNGVTVDIVNTPEQILVDNWDATGTENVPDPFNTSSVNLVFTLSSSGKRILIGGDSTMITMKYLMNAYGENNYTLANINVFAAYHHGKNVLNDYYGGTHTSGTREHYEAIGNNGWADFLLGNTNNVSAKFDVMLFPYFKMYEMTLREDITCGAILGCSGTYVGDDGAVVYPYNIGECNQYYADNSTLYFTTGYQDSVSATEGERHGTVEITFAADGTISYQALDSVHTQE